MDEQGRSCFAQAPSGAAVMMAGGGASPAAGGHS
jgi:hypothetical protein